MQKLKEEPFTKEDFETATELYESLSDAFSRLFIPFIVIDGKRVKTDIERVKEKLEKLVV